VGSRLGVLGWSAAESAAPAVPTSRGVEHALSAPRVPTFSLPS